jgi:hypothetical protein
MAENTVVTSETVNVDEIKNGTFDSNNEPVKTDPVKAEPTKAYKTESAEIERLKKLLSKANGEAANYKQQLRDKQTETERAEAERAEQEQAMREELETLRKEKQVSDYTARCVALNMEADLAAQTANALSDGNMDAVFDCLRQFVDATEKRLNNEALNRQPGLSAGVPPTANSVTDEETAKLRRYAGLPAHR